MESEGGERKEGSIKRTMYFVEEGQELTDVSYALMLEYRHTVFIPTRGYLYTEPTSVYVPLALLPATGRNTFVTLKPFFQQDHQ